VLARQVYPYALVYAATKYAVRAICRGLRIELNPYGIKVTEVAPGLTDTGVFRFLEHPAVKDAYADRGYPPLAPEDIAQAIVAAAASGPNVCPQVIEVNPLGQV
jgi:NADP-dependent 3-hydroxy acid dehydrogenase YdfG